MAAERPSRPDPPPAPPLGVRPPGVVPVPFDSTDSASEDEQETVRLENGARSAPTAVNAAPPPVPVTLPPTAQPLEVPQIRTAPAQPSDSGELVKPSQTVDAADDTPPLTDVAARSGPPWLVSAIVHLLLLLALGLWAVITPRPQLIELEAELQQASDDLGEQLDDRPLTIADEHLDQEMELALTDLRVVEDPFAAPPEMEIVPDGLNSASNIDAVISGMALDGRQEGMRQTLLAAYGGNAESEAAVARALRWLAKQQETNGSWSLKGPYADGSVAENRSAATAMAMLAFQGAGHTHLEGEYREVVAEGLRWLLKQQDDEGNFYREGGHNHALYTHAQCTIVLCELWAITRDTSIRRAAEDAIKYCVYSQDPRLGGWKYRPRNGSDLSVTGWMVMALQSAKMGELDVPAKTLAKVEQFLEAVSVSDGARYSYMENGPGTLSMTAEGLLCRQYLGWQREDPRMQRGVDYIMRSLPSWRADDRDVYYWYYATQVLHHLAGSEWETWNQATRDLLVEKQIKEGPEEGSWHPFIPSADRWGHYGGRLFVTCLSTYILEVYYRHLPIYQTDLARQ